jgi:hypothetical protein
MMNRLPTLLSSIPTCAATYWNSTLRRHSEHNQRIFEVLQGPNSQNPGPRAYLEHADFRPVLRAILDTHPGYGPTIYWGSARHVTQRNLNPVFLCKHGIL